MNAYATAKNTSYLITATIKGEGTTEPDKEDTKNDLNINVQVQPWNLMINNQTIE